jgi:hypothetical protein
VLGSRANGSAWGRAAGRAAAGFALVLAAAAARGEDVDAAYASAPLERDLGRMFAGRAETPAFLLRYRPGSQAENGHDELAQKLEDAAQKLRKRLDLKQTAKIQAFLYDTTDELAHLTGRTAEGAVAIGSALHVPLDHPEVGEALARLLEPEWGRAGDKVGGALEPGRRYHLRLLARGGQLEGFLDEKAFFKTQVPTQAGAIAFGVESGRLSLRDLKVREAPADPKKDPDGPWIFPLRTGVGEWEFDYPGRWKQDPDALECVRYGELSKARLTRVEDQKLALKDLELEAELRLSEGAAAEVEICEATDRAVRLYFTPQAVIVAVVDPQRVPPRLATGPVPALREGLVLALAAELDGRSLGSIGRALLEKNLVPPLKDMLRNRVPPEGTDRARRRLLLGAFVAYAISEKPGIAKYRDFHFSDLADEKTTPLGTYEELDDAWRAWLRDVKRSPEDKVERELGLDALEPAAAWKDLTADAAAKKFKTKGGGRWSFDAKAGAAWDGAPGGASGDALLTEPAPAKGAARLSVRFAESSKVRVKLVSRDGKESSALLATSGAQLVTPGNTIAGKTAFPLNANHWYDVVFVLDGAGAARVYLDGELAAEGTGLAAGPGTWQIECEGRRVEVRAVAVRKLEG